MTPNDREHNEEQKSGPVITDKRHARELDAAEEPASAAAPEEPVAPAPAPDSEQPAAQAPVPEETASPEVVEFTRPAPAESSVPEEEQAGPVENDNAGDEDAYAQAEMEHLKMLFGAGLVNYLRSQLGLLLNFALIGLGRAPNPATGLVSTELDKAKLAIDLLEYIAARLKGQLPAQEEQEITRILAELKYTYIQLAGGAPAPGNGGGPEA